MQVERFSIDGLPCVLYAQAAPRALLLQATDANGLDRAEQVYCLTADRVAMPFALAAFGVRDWNTDLSPWNAPPVFGMESFGHGARDTLRMVTDTLLPRVLDRLRPESGLPVILGGYSLAALFALWSAYQTGCFAAVCASSPSVWFPGWIAYAQAHTPLARCVYLSLGDREEKTRNAALAAVGDCIRSQYRLLQEADSIVSTLEWNPGNHFQDPELRCAKGFAWAMAHTCGRAVLSSRL